MARWFSVGERIRGGEDDRSDMVDVVVLFCFQVIDSEWLGAFLRFRC